MQQKQISKILHGEAQTPEGHGVSPGDIIQLQTQLLPLTLWLKPHAIIQSLEAQEVTMPLTTGQKNNGHPSLLNDRLGIQ